MLTLPGGLCGARGVFVLLCVGRSGASQWVEEERRSSGKCPSRALSYHDDTLAVMGLDADDAQTTGHSWKHALRFPVASFSAGG